MPELLRAITALADDLLSRASGEAKLILSYTGLVPRGLSIKAAETNVVSFPTPVKVKNPAAVALGKLGGSKGGKIRAERLSPERKKTIAQQAAQARWTKARLNERGEG